MSKDNWQVDYTTPDWEETDAPVAEDHMVAAPEYTGPQDTPDE
jgi:hypothetical protein